VPTPHHVCLSLISRTVYKFTCKKAGQHTALSGIVGNRYLELIRMCLLCSEELFDDAVMEKWKSMSHDESE
jgi:hypothetical protein